MLTKDKTEVLDKLGFKVLPNPDTLAQTGLRQISQCMPFQHPTKSAIQSDSVPLRPVGHSGMKHSNGLIWVEWATPGACHVMLRAEGSEMDVLGLCRAG